MPIIKGVCLLHFYRDFIPKYFVWTHILGKVQMRPCRLIALFTCSEWESQQYEETSYPPVWLRDEEPSRLVPEQQKMKHVHKFHRKDTLGIWNVRTERELGGCNRASRFERCLWRTQSELDSDWRVRWPEEWAPWGRLPRRTPGWGRRCHEPSPRRTACAAAMSCRDTSSWRNVSRCTWPWWSLSSPAWWEMWEFFFCMLLSVNAFRWLPQSKFRAFSKKVSNISS